MLDELKPTAANIAADLAIAIHQRAIDEGAQLPSQARLARIYKVADATAAAALGKLVDAGLVYTVPARGTFVTRNLRGPGAHAFPRETHPVLDMLSAAEICRRLACTHFGGAAPTIGVGGDPDWDDPHRDPEKVMPPRRVDVAALEQLDRHVLRWMSEMFVAEARRVVGHGLAESDQHLVAAARAIVRDGGRRPDEQAPIAYVGGPQRPGEDVIRRIWPERAYTPGPDDAPF